MAEKKAAKKAGAKKASSGKKAAPAKKGAAGKKAAKKAGVKKATSSPRAARTPTHDEIAQRAYEIHEREGGHHEQNWLQAERELKGE